ncbi:TBC-domain-containing protein [Ascobolus immersus RN42]|uniref:TBC-domain-containing protein n=1 Tax=Ascobolus immersus RN42 TaxID=1160509 RepID=A0A3N4HMB9_ASCIM|nr:TBC-domain-containing protein [Ascobolus immersus RN42]
MSRAPSGRRSRSPLPTSTRPSRQSSQARSPLGMRSVPGNLDTQTLKTTILKHDLQESPTSIRSPLFEDHVPTSYLPGSLHHAPDSAIDSLIARHGAVQLVRQLAEDLAHRDKELVLVRQRAEERERLLKGMLREVEVSNLDIERRLSTIQKPKVLADVTLEGLDCMIREAMGEQVGVEEFEEVEEVPVVVNGTGEVDGDGRGYGDEDGKRGETGSVRSNRSGSSAKGGWGKYIWGGKPKNGSTKSREARKRIDEGTFTPPTEPMSRSQSRTSFSESGSKLIRTTSNRSFTDGLKSPPAETRTTELPRERRGSNGWTLKLVANTPARKSKKAPTARDDLQKLISKSHPPQSRQQLKTTRIRAGSTSLKTKMPTPTTFSSPMGDQPAVATPPAINDGNLGPVEMDTIIDRADQPPTLLPNLGGNGDYVTDRFGFIYDRKAKDTESIKSTSSTGSYPTRRGMLPPPITTSTDRLATSPGSSIVTPVQEEPEPPTAVEIHRGFNNPNNPFPIPSPRISSFHTPPAPDSKSSLLTQDPEKEKENKWNEFLRRVRVQQSRKGESGGENPETAIGDGEVVGVAGLGNSGEGRKRWGEFVRLVYGGVPVEVRWKIWAECTGACTLRIPSYYSSLLENAAASTDNDDSTLTQILSDIPRTLTSNIFFLHGPGRQKLRNLLHAYALRNPTVGYCQGMNMIAASLLLITPTEEDAFWMLCSIVEHILPATYFEPSLLASRADQRVLKGFVKELLPAVWKHLSSLGVELEASTFQWFLSIFTDTLSAEPLFRIWDVLFCVDPTTFLFQVALALLKLNEKRLLECKTAAEAYAFLGGEIADSMRAASIKSGKGSVMSGVSGTSGASGSVRTEEVMGGDGVKDVEVETPSPPMPLWLE